MPVADANFIVATVPPLMKTPHLWIKSEDGGVQQIGMLVELQTVASFVEDIPLSSCWWPYGRAIISTRLQVRSSWRLESQIIVITSDSSWGYKVATCSKR